MSEKSTGYYFILSIIWISCQNSHPSVNQAKGNELDSLKMKFAPILAGDWVASSYFDSVKLSKSPYRSQTALPEIVEFRVDLQKPIPDSVTIGAINIHEGASLILYFRRGKLETSLPINLEADGKGGFYELGYRINNQDTTLWLYQYNRHDSLVSTIKYSKVPNHKEEAFQYQLNKTLFSGIYNVIDSSGNSSEVEFTNDGAVIGMQNWNKYFVIADFVAAGDSAADELCFKIQTKRQVCYAYKISGDTLQLFDEIENQQKEFLKLGDKKYEFVKKK